MYTVSCVVCIYVNVQMYAYVYLLNNTYNELVSFFFIVDLLCNLCDGIYLNNLECVPLSVQSMYTLVERQYISEPTHLLFC